MNDHIVLIEGVPFKMIDGEIKTFPCWFNHQLSGGKMSWKASWWKRIKSYLIWKPRHLIYRLLGLPDEIEESIGGLNWAVKQNAGRLEIIEGFLVLDGEYDVLELAKAAAVKTTMSADELFQKILDDCKRQEDFLERAYETFIRSMSLSKLTKKQKREALFRAILKDMDWSGK